MVKDFGLNAIKWSQTLVQTSGGFKEKGPISSLQFELFNGVTQNKFQWKAKKKKKGGSSALPPVMPLEPFDLLAWVV